MRTLGAAVLFRAAVAVVQPAVGSAVVAMDTAAMLFASGRLTWWRSVSSQHAVASSSHVMPAAAATPGVSIPDTLQGPTTAQRPDSRAATHAAGATIFTDEARHTLPQQEQQTLPTMPAAPAETRPAEAATATAAASRPRAELKPGRRRVNWKLDHSIEWTPQLAADAQQFWREQGVIRPVHLKRLARWTELSPVFRNLPQLAQRMDAWREAAHRFGRPQADALRLVLSERAMIERSADPNRILGNMLAIEQAFAAHGLSSHGLLRSRVLQNKTDTIVERIPMFIESIKSWPVKVDYAAMLEKNPGFLSSHSNNFEVYTERVTAFVQWAPPTLDLNKFLVGAPTLLNLLPALVQQRYAALQELLQLDEEQMVQFMAFAPGLLSRRPATNAWKIAYHREYAEHRAREGFGDELKDLYTPEQFPSRLCNLLLQSADRVQRLRYLSVEQARAGETDVLSRTGYSWARLATSAWHSQFPDFAEWLERQPRNPGATESSSSDDDPERVQ